MAEKSLYELTEKELIEALSTQANRNLVVSYNDVRNEIERRRQQRNADRVFYLSILAISVSVISLVTSVFAVLFK